MLDDIAKLAGQPSLKRLNTAQFKSQIWQEVYAVWTLPVITFEENQGLHTSHTPCKGG